MQESKNNQETSFLKVDRHDMEKGFDPLELLIISEVKGWNRKGKPCFVSNNGFCKMFNINSRSTIIKRIEQLVKKGHLIREYKVINGNKVRYLSIPPSTKNELPSIKNVLPSTDIELPNSEMTSIKNVLPSTDIELPNSEMTSTKNELPSIKNVLPSSKNGIGVVQNLHSPSSKIEPYKNINKNKNKNINKNPKTEQEPINDKLPDSGSIELTPEKKKAKEELERMIRGY